MLLASSTALRGLARAPLPRRAPVRFLNLHEYRSQSLMKTFGIAVPLGDAASEVPAARAAADAIVAAGADPVVKAQVLAGGRGLGSFANGFRSGVHMCYSAEDAAAVAGKMLGQTLITKQTGAVGKPCNEVFITEKVYARREMYFAILYDRETSGPVIVASSRGGTSIEDIAEQDPSAIKKIPLNIFEGMTDEIALETAKALGFTAQKSIEECADQVKRLYKMFSDKDCTLLEVNPLVETPAGHVVSVDAKLNFDDNAEFRQADVFSQRDVSQEDPREVAAAKFDLNYIGLDGNIGCLVNGAGLAMATMDIIKLHGGNPANFLDVGGSATETQVTEAFKILDTDPKVEAILVNIFGGIMRCDVIARGIVSAAKEVGLRVPLVVRLQGNKVDEARKIIAESGLSIAAVDDLDMAAKKAVGLAEVVRVASENGVNVKIEY